MKNLVVMCDGTSNSIEPDLSNIGRLLRCLSKDETQRVFYRTGVGSAARQAFWSLRLREAQALWEQATGYGIDDDVCAIYRFICCNHEPGDKICLFGFSRGAYTVRIVAALIHMAGLLPPDQSNLAEQLLATYKRIGEKDGQAIASDFAEVGTFAKIADARRATVHFLGLFDTVSSVIVPGRNLFGFLPGTSRLPYTRENPSVRTVRHAVSIDERRSMFRSNRWVEKQLYVEDPFASPPVSIDQDVKQVLFSGVHADIGGGYPEKAAGLAKIPLSWLIGEAKAHGIRFRDRRVRRFVLGEKERDSDAFSKPVASADMHRSLAKGWWILEVFPKKKSLRETRTLSLFGLYIPFGERRAFIARETPLLVHRSVLDRIEATGCTPPNLPGAYNVEEPKAGPPA